MALCRLFALINNSLEFSGLLNLLAACSIALCLLGAPTFEGDAYDIKSHAQRALQIIGFSVLSLFTHDFC
jgi:hypothetical protein